MAKDYVGIDIAKEKYDVAHLGSEGKIKTYVSANNSKAHAKLVKAFKDQDVQVIMEATGTYHQKLEEALHDAGIAVTVINPRQALAYAKSRNRRNKTDKVDALLLAEFGRERQPDANSSLMSLAQGIARELEALEEDLSRLRNRLEAAMSGVSHPKVIASLKRRKKQLEREKQALKKQLENDVKEQQSQELSLVQSIPGIGSYTASLLLAELGNPLRFQSARSLVAFAGLTPKIHESGKGSRYTAISRMGSSHLRRWLYMPALAAIRMNKPLKAFYQRLISKGKPKKVAVVAVMAKLLKLVYGVLKHNKSFDPNYTT